MIEWIKCKFHGFKQNSLKTQIEERDNKIKTLESEIERLKEDICNIKWRMKII